MRTRTLGGTGIPVSEIAGTTPRVSAFFTHALLPSHS